MYKLLVDKDKIDNTCRTKWEFELGSEIQEHYWDQTNKYVLDISINSAIQEAFVKLSNRWYLVPTRLHIIFPKMYFKCW